MNRRAFLNHSALLAGATGLSPLLRAGPAAGKKSPSRGLRIAHITDTHVFDQRDCPKSMKGFLKALAAVRPAPDLILHTGDVIFDAMGQPEKDFVDAQWRLWHSMAADLTAPVRYCLGNHDIWSAEDRNDVLYGKRRAMAELGLERPYYRFERDGWNFFMLDSIQPLGDRHKRSYAANFGETQRQWLAAELAALPASAPVVIGSHAPILSAGIFDLGRVQHRVQETPDGPEDAPAWVVRALLMHDDSSAVRDILRRRSGATLCLGGHLHLTENIVYNGIHFLGSGAVCADWWRTPYFHNSHCGFAILDLQPDGKWAHQFVPFEWTT